MSSTNDPDHMVIRESMSFIKKHDHLIQQVRVDYYLLTAHVDCLGSPGQLTYYTRSVMLTNLLACWAQSSGGHKATQQRFAGDLIPTVSAKYAPLHPQFHQL